MNEAEFSRQMVALLRGKGWFVTSLEDKWNSGIPDLYAIKGGRSIFIELKVDNGKGFKMRPNQLPWLMVHKAHGGENYVVVRRNNGDIEWLDCHLEDTKGVL